MGAYLSQNDTIMWMVEADPLLRSTIMGVVVLDGAPDWSRLQDRMSRVTHQVPALREKVVPVPLHPTKLQWVHDHDFELAYHLRRIRLPEHSTQQDLLDWARTQAMGGFDSARPLWEFTVVEGLSAYALEWLVQGRVDGAVAWPPRARAARTQSSRVRRSLRCSPWKRPHSWSIGPYRRKSPRHRSWIAPSPNQTAPRNRIWLSRTGSNGGTAAALTPMLACPCTPTITSIAPVSNAMADRVAVMIFTSLIVFPLLKQPRHRRSRG